MKKKRLAQVTDQLILQYGYEKTPEILDKIKNFGYHYATLSGISWGHEDLIVPPEKGEIIKEAKEKVRLIDEQYKEVSKF